MAAKSKTPTWLIALYVLGMLLTGTLNTLTTKIQFTMTSVGLDGEEKVFSKPWFGTFNMLFAMFLVLAIEQFTSKVLCRRVRSEGEIALIDDSCGPVDKNTISYGKKVCLVAIPAAFDLFATALCCMGILYIPASVWQMLRGASIIFAAIFSITFLKRRMLAFNWFGLSLCVVGIILVGLANVWGSASADKGSAHPSDPATMVLGMALVLFGQVVQAAQVIAEEWLMKDVDLPSLQIVGYEGMWGIVMMIVMVYPALYLLPGTDGGHMEDPFDTAVMVYNSPELMQCVLVYLFSCGTFNVTGIAVTGALSAVHRMMLDASRTTVIWGFGLYVHYKVNPESPFGEVWTPYSYMQLFGFLILVIGQSVYGEVLKLPCFAYPKPVVSDPSKFASPGAMTNLASPLPREA